MKYLLWIVVFISLSGCITVPQLPEELKYVMPSSDEAGVSSINATMIDDKVPLFDDDNTYVYAINGKKVMLEEEQWEQPVFITPGSHDVTLGFTKGAHMLFAKVHLTVAASTAYKAMSTCKTGFLGNYEYCDFWIVDSATGKAVSDVARGAYTDRRHPLNL
jgi:hypothetical protein